ncbi:uncharacterized protein LOC110634672 isoform X2 [Hevea brasiliensis]|uniref:uncharacterized protein LOC110634672 isoform X2 n=1 Tax=Hevea brasiliensis TaxID=3981 RepID=UPI0025EC64F2|nr:uncharacterized protein LOC110634672 isoform X2 [Hevea brasiliensis]
MAASAISFDQEIPAIVDGNCDLSVDGSCFQLVKPCFDEVNQPCSLDVLPLLFEKASFPVEEKCAFQTAHGQDIYSISMLSEEDKTNPKYAYSPCIVDIDIEMKNFEKKKSNNEAVGSIKSEGLLTGVLQRQASLKTCGRLMQLFTNHGSTLLKLISKDKSFNERVYDTPNNRWRKYKRAASFDSRKVVLLFSILSSLGTLILIYLTLRVRQTADGFVNV